MFQGNGIEDVQDVSGLPLRLAHAANQEGLAARAQSVACAPANFAIGCALDPCSAGDVPKPPCFHEPDGKRQAGPYRPHHEEAVSSSQLPHRQRKQLLVCHGLIVRLRAFLVPFRRPHLEGPRRVREDGPILERGQVPKRPISLHCCPARRACALVAHGPKTSHPRPHPAPLG